MHVNHVTDELKGTSIVNLTSVVTLQSLQVNRAGKSKGTSIVILTKVITLQSLQLNRELGEWRGR